MKVFDSNNSQSSQYYNLQVLKQNIYYILLKFSVAVKHFLHNIFTGENMKSFLAVIIFLLLVIKAIEGLPLSESQDNSQSLERRTDSTEVPDTYKFKLSHLPF